MTVASPPPPPGAPVPKKGLGPLGWIAIGCGAIALIGILAFAVGGYMLKKKFENPTLAAAELAVRANPDLEVVSSDPKAGTLTIKDTKTGKTVTMNAEDIKEGKLTFETDEGTTVIDTSQAGESGSVKVTGADGQQVTWGGEAPKNLPAWVPIYPGSTVTGAMDATNAEGRSAMFSISSEDEVDKVIEFYESKLNEGGLKVSKQTIDANGQHSAILTATSEDDKRTVSAMIGQSEGKTQGTVNFSEKK